MSPLQRERKPRKDKDLRPAASPLSAPFQRAGKNVENAAEPPPDLAQVAAAWQHLPKAVILLPAAADAAALPALPRSTRATPTPA